MVSVLIKSDTRYEVNRKALRDAVRTTLSEQGVTGEQEVSVFVVGNRKMRSLNAKYRDIHETTDVLSFPYAEGGQFIESPDQVRRLGDIVLSYPEAVRQAAIDNVLVDEEITKLVSHGTMHLLGFDHDALGKWFFR